MIKNIKKIIGFLCSVAFCTTIAIGVPKIVKAAEEVAINETNFPDEIFRDYVTSEFDRDSNGKLSEGEIANVQNIDIYNKGVSSLAGIEYFTALTTLDCSINQLTSLDVSHNTTLTDLYCQSNQLTSLDVSHNTALKNLYCYSNKLISLNINGATALTDLDCPENQLTVLDVSHNIVLTYLDCDSNQLTSLDVSHNTALKNLSCYSNKLTSLDVSKNTELQSLNCYINQLTSLDVSHNTALKNLYCQFNQLTSLDVSHNTALKNLKCDFNQLTNLDVNGATTLTYLCCEENQLTVLDVSKNTILKDLFCSSNQLTSLNVNHNTALTDLYCNSNQLTSLDVSHNTALKNLSCYSNKLMSLDINGATALTYLKCNSNQLTVLDVSKNTALKVLYCDENQLIVLDISKNTALTFLDCAENQLTELKLNSQTYDKLSLYKEYLHGDASLSDLQNITETATNNFITISLLKVTDITKPATYKVDGKDFKIIYVNTVIMPSESPSPEPNVTPSPTPTTVPNVSPVPSLSPVIPSDTHIFSDYNYNNPVTANEAVIYGNGANLTVDGKKMNNKVFTAYTDILASYKYTVNSKGIVKPSVGKVIVGVTKSNVKPEVSNKSKITDTSASNIARARIKNGQITVTAVGKEGGLVYLWVIDTGSKGISACCPINVKLAPTKLEVQNTTGSKLTNTKLANGDTLEVCITGLVSGSTKTEDCTYTATVDSKYQSYIAVTPVKGSTNKFTIKAVGLKNNKDTKAAVTFKCDQNNKKANFSLTVTQ